MFTLYSDKLPLIFDTFCSKNETIYHPYNQIPEQYLLINSLAINLKYFQEKCYQRSKQSQEELQKLRETYHYKQHKILINKQTKNLDLFLIQQTEDISRKMESNK